MSMTNLLLWLVNNLLEGRGSGTNDKAGAPLNLMMALSKNHKETFRPPTDWRYPFLDEK